MRELIALLAVGRHERHAEGAVLVREGSEASRLYLILRGELAARRAGVEIERHVAGDLVDRGPLLEALPARATLRARTDAEVLVFSGKDLRRLCLRKPRLGVRLLARLNRRLHGRVDPAA